MITTIVTGHVGNVRFTSKPGKPEEGGFSVLNFSVASNETTKTGKEVTTWVTCKLWGARAEALSKHLSRGQAVAVEGRPEARGYQAEDGSIKSDQVVHVSVFEFIGPKPDGAPTKVTSEEGSKPEQTVNEN